MFCSSRSRIVGFRSLSVRSADFSCCHSSPESEMYPCSVKYPCSSFAWHTCPNGTGINGAQKLRADNRISVCCADKAQPQVVQITDIRLPYEIIRICGKLAKTALALGQLETVNACTAAKQFLIFREKGRSIAALTSGKLFHCLIFCHATPSFLFGNSSLKLMYLPPVSSRIDRSVICLACVFSDHIPLTLVRSAFRQQVRPPSSLVSSFLRRSPEAVIFPEDKTEQDRSEHAKFFLALIDRLTAAGAGADHVSSPGANSFLPFLGNTGVGRTRSPGPSARIPSIKASASAPPFRNLRQLLFPFCGQHGRGERLGQDGDKVEYRPLWG